MNGFNAALVTHSVGNREPRLIDGLILTKFDTIDDKVGPMSPPAMLGTMLSHPVAHTLPTLHTLLCTPLRTLTIPLD